MDIKFWNKLNDAERAAALTRPAQNDSAKVGEIVRSIIDNIKKDGDKALRRYSKELDKYEGKDLEFTKEEIKEACSRVSGKLKKAINLALANIKAFHAAQKPCHVTLETFPGITCMTATHPIESVGLYVPGGSAPLVSTALMLAVPAKIAGCSEIILCSPPPVSDAIVYAAHKAGVKRIFRIGGAQAVAAMAYGTKSVPKVLKIFGPGNQFVTMAKRMVSEDPNGAAIEMPAGPSEVLVIADDKANPELIAADLLSQAEHGPDSQVILLSPSEKQIKDSLAAVDRQLQALPRKEIAQKALSKSTAIVCKDLDECAEISCKYAPEHLIVQTQKPKALLPKLRNAGSIFLGAYTPESLGDYASGTNHTLPTYGYARTASALGTDDFRRRFTVSHASKKGIIGIAATVEALAAAEGLDAHKNAAAIRVKAAKGTI